jgi:hypothetical protein
MDVTAGAENHSSGATRKGGETDFCVTLIPLSHRAENDYVMIVSSADIDYQLPYVKYPFTVRTGEAATQYGLDNLKRWLSGSGGPLDPDAA